MSDAMKKKKQERCFSKLTIISSAKLYNFVFSFPVSITSVTLVPFFFAVLVMTSVSVQYKNDIRYHCSWF